MVDVCVFSGTTGCVSPHTLSFFLFRMISIRMFGESSHSSFPVRFDADLGDKVNYGWGKVLKQETKSRLICLNFP